jgi:hypothetical protein
VSPKIRYIRQRRGTEAELQALVRHVDEIAEIPNSLRAGTEVRLGNAVVRSRGEAGAGT